MVRIRQGWLVALALAFGLGGLLASCKKDDKAGTATGDQAAEKTGGATNDDLSLLPADSELVVGMNVEQIQRSPLYKQMVEPMLKSGGMQHRMTDFVAKCGYDPMTSVKSAALGIKGSGDTPVIVAVVHGLDKAKILACADKTKDDLAKEGGEMTRDGDVLLVKGRRGQVAFLFTSDSTMVMLSSDHADAAAVKAVAAGSSGIRARPRSSRCTRR